MSDVREGLRFVWRTPFLRTTMLLISGSNFISNGVGLTLMLAIRQHGASATLVGLMLTISAVGGLLGSLVAPTVQKRLSPFAAVTLVGIIWTILIALFPLNLNPFIVSALLAAMLFAGPTLNAILVGRQIATVPNRLQARVAGAASMLTTGAIAVGTLASGFMLDQLGATTTIEVFAACMALLTVVFVRSHAVRWGLAT
jgi:predicted MFS family arabinose efflux permease